MRSLFPAASALWALVFLLGFVSVPLQANASAPRQYQLHFRSLNEQVDDSNASLSSIHVLPPSPDDTPKECEAASKYHDSCGPDRYCSALPGNGNETTTTYYCLHKTLWYPALDARDILAFLLIGICCFLAAMGGIGGGGLILPILLLCCNFTPKEASVLSNTAVFCNTLGQFCVNNWNRPSRHSDNISANHQSSIIYSTVLMIMPGVIAGGSIAITLEGLVPSTVILVLAFFTLILASTKTYHKAQKMRAAERELSPTTPESPSSLAISPTSSRNPTLEEVREDEALIASGLEWSADTNHTSPVATPASKINSPLSDASDVLEEAFLGSIRYLNREEIEENCVNIIDESSMTASFDFGAQSEATSITTAVAGNESGRSAHQDEDSRNSLRCEGGGCQALLLCFYQKKLQFLILGFWVLDATTFLLLHSGTLVRKCSAAFFALIGLPAVVAAVFVWVGRRHLMAQRTSHRTNSDVEAEETQPLISRFLPPISPIAYAGDNDEEGETYEPVPSIAAESEQSSLPADNRKWVLLVPLISAFAGIFKALQGRRPATYRQTPPQNADDPQDLSVPLLGRSPIEIGSQPEIDRSLLAATSGSAVSLDEETRLRESLLTCWLPWASFLIGLLAALLGIGGGELLGPILLLLLKMDPKQSSATTAIMSMMNSGTNLLHYIVADMMTAPGYAINLGFAGLLGGSWGRLQAMSMADTGRTSVIAISLFVVLSIATTLVAWELFTTPVSWASDGGVC